MAKTQEYDLETISFKFQYAGDAVESGLMDVRDLAPALLALSDLCEQSNYEANGNVAKARVQVRAFAPGSIVVELMLALSLTGLVRFNPLTTAKEVFDLAKSAIELAKALKGAKVTDVTALPNGDQRLTVNHNHTIDVSDRLYNLISRRPVQQDLQQIVAPLKRDGIDLLNIIEGGKTVESVTSDDVQSFDVLPVALPSAEDETLETTSEVEKTYKVVTISSDPRQQWVLSDGSSRIKVKIGDGHLHQAANDGHLGVEPGFIVKVRIRSETRLVNGDLKTDNYLVKILSVRPPEPKDDGSHRLL